jgi:hypothetical protein|nr:hypothetical protein [uncultured Mediterranean phage uvMED]
MGSVGKKIKKVVKKIARPKVLLPLAALMIGGPMLSKALAAKGGISGALLGQAATTGTNVLPALHGAGTAIGSGATSGLLGAGGKFALGKGAIGKGIMAGLKNPLSLKGAATYGGLAAAGMGLLGDKEEGGDPDGPTGAKAQSMYDSFLLSGRNAGYTDEEINTIYKPYGDMYYGDYQTVNTPARSRKRQFPGTNYPIYAAEGGIMQAAPGVPQGMELDYRNTGGFIPMGGQEKADDVPAMLSRNEFVMTADAVRGMGGGDVNAGAQKMYDLMNNLEAKA